MANFAGHITTSAMLGVAVGAVGSIQFHYDWGPVFLAAGLTTVGGMLPDLDSDSGIPVREMFGLAGAVVPILLLPRLSSHLFTIEQLLVILGAVYMIVRYGLAELFKRITVHRGMFHSIPAMLIAGLAIFVLYHTENQQMRLYFAAGTMVGFLSHLVLDEIFAVDLMGVVPTLNQFAGSALKLTSKSMMATALTYFILFILGTAAWSQLQPAQPQPSLPQALPKSLPPVKFP
jgi:hypothetical protein